MPQALATRSDERRRLRTPPGLLPDARHVVLPEGICSSGLPAVEQTLALLGLGLDPWQRDAAACILGKTATGLYAADTVVLSIPRQVGKTFLVGLLVFADCIVNPGTLTVWTAHRFKVSRETFDELRGLAMLPALAPHIDPDAITTAAGNETIPFRNGSRIVFAARERGSIRGFRKVRRLVLDEAQILTEAAMSDLAPTQNQAVNPQMILMGTPPKPSDQSERFTSLREAALADEAEATVYIELSAEPGSDLDDRAAWAVGNPSLGTRTPERAIERLRRLLSDDDFLREVMGIWTLEAGVALLHPDLWRSSSVGSQPPRAPVLSLEVALDGSRTCVGAAWLVKDRPHVEPFEDLPGTDVVARVEEHRVKYGVTTVVLDSGTQAADFAPKLKTAGFTVVEVSKGADRAAACASFHNLASTGGLSHNGDPALAAALANARWKDVGEGARAFSRRKSAGSIAELYAVTLALHGLNAAPASTYEGRGLVTL
jgi:phage terminase large subunit-like protein